MSIRTFGQADEGLSWNIGTALQDRTEQRGHRVKHGSIRAV